MQRLTGTGARRAHITLSQGCQSERRSRDDPRLRKVTLSQAAASQTSGPDDELIRHTVDVVVGVQRSGGDIHGVGLDVVECGVEGFAQRLNISRGLCEQKSALEGGH